MTNTTVERVRAIAPHLREMATEDLQVFVDDAIAETDGERLQRWLAAHLATIHMRRPTSQSVSGVSVGYSDVATGPGLASTEYGQEYMRLRDIRIGLQLYFEVI